MGQKPWRVWVLTLAVAPLGGCFLLGEAALEGICSGNCGDGWGFSAPADTSSTSSSSSSTGGNGSGASSSGGSTSGNGSGGASSSGVVASSSVASGGASSGNSGVVSSSAGTSSGAVSASGGSSGVVSSTSVASSVGASSGVASSSTGGVSSSVMGSSSSAASSSSSGAFPSVLVPGAGAPNYLAVHAGKLYWTNRGNRPITSVNVDGSGLAAVTANKTDAWDILVNAEGVFWTGGIAGISMAGSAGYVEGRLTLNSADTVYATGLTNPRTVLVHASEVFSVSNNSFCVRRFPIGGGAAVNALSCGTTSSMGILGSTLWTFNTFGAYKSLATNFSDMAVVSDVGDLGNATNVVRVKTTPNALFVSAADGDGGAIYSFNGIAHVPIIDAPQTVNPAVASHFAYDMALDGTWLYYTTQPRVSSGETGSVFRIDLTNTAAGPQNLLAPGVQNQRRYGIVLDPPWIIFGQETDIARIPIPQ